MRRSFGLSGLILASLLASACAHGAARDYYCIKVVDEQTGRGVPLVELETVEALKFVTDSNGTVAFNEPGFMGQETWFSIRSHGYEFPKDGFGFAGVRLTPKAGQSVKLKIKRVNIAERLYRITGEGIYSDSVLVGENVPLKRPVLNGQVLGQDSVMAFPFRGKLYWFWGDTNRAGYPLGQFAMSGATSLPPDKGGLDPEKGVDLEYFVDEKGFSRKMCPLPEPGLVWLDGMCVFHDEAGDEQLACRYTRLKDLGHPLEQGIAVYNGQRETFERVAKFELDNKWRIPRAQPIRVKDGGEDWFVFPAPLPNTRVKAKLQNILDPTAYEAFTCLAPGTKYSRGDARVERSADGKVVYAWKANTDPIGQREERELISAGQLKPEEARFQVRDIDSDKAVDIHGGSVYWNEHLERWIMIAVQAGGTSFLGEVWLAEAPRPTGPWKFAKKIVTHDRYTFYNPTQHPFFDQKGGRIVYFEGTYANTFSGNDQRTPRYDYNQIMYRLDLDDPRLEKLHRAMTDK